MGKSPRPNNVLLIQQSFTQWIYGPHNSRKLWKIIWLVFIKDQFDLIYTNVKNWEKNAHHNFSALKLKSKYWFNVPKNPQIYLILCHKSKYSHLKVHYVVFEKKSKLSLSSQSHENLSVNTFHFTLSRLLKMFFPEPQRTFEKPEHASVRHVWMKMTETTYYPSHHFLWTTTIIPLNLIPFLLCCLLIVYPIQPMSLCASNEMQINKLDFEHGPNFLLINLSIQPGEAANLKCFGTFARKMTLLDQLIDWLIDCLIAVPHHVEMRRLL